MKNIVTAALTVALACLLAGNAWADRPWHHPRTSVELGFYWGGPIWWYPPYHPYPVYAAPPIVVVPPAAPPPVYIEQPRVAPPLEPGYWYYCREAQAYYPYVKECPGPWEKVAPQPRQ
ncbi:MAG: hypothetical protein ACK4Q4_03085 [Rhodocyclaceae bacterium]